MLSRLLFTIIPVFIASSLFGSHLVGGSLTYKDLGGGDYSIRLELMRDCLSSGAAFDNRVKIGIYKQDSILLNFVNIDFSGETEFIDLPISNHVCNVGSAVCLEKTVYETTINLPSVEGGYTVVYQRCCRNDKVQNLEDPIELGFTFYTEINPTVPNSSPTFLSQLPLVGFANSSFTYSLEAIDSDGDSLVYEIAYPLNGASQFDPVADPVAPPYDTIPYFLPEYTIDNILGGSHPVSINKQTGEITGTPEMLGVYQVAYTVKEFRNGQLIGTNIREFPFLVLPPNESVKIEVLGEVLKNDTINASSRVGLFVKDNSTDSLFLYEEQWVMKDEKYAFNELPIAVYYLKVTPDTMVTLDNYIPTYSDSVIFWYQATPLNFCDTTEGSKNIRQLTVDSLKGSQSLSGFILSIEGDNEPVSGLSLILMNNNSEVLAQTYTKRDGSYEFTSLEIGSYSIYVDLINSKVLNDFAPRVELIGDTSITYYLYDDRISSEFISIGEWAAEKNLKVYPNPVSQTLFVENSTANRQAELLIVNAMGAWVYKRKMNGSEVQIDVSQFPNGMYYLILNTENGQSQFSKVIVTQVD